MLTECLREQKHTKAKLVKACKYAKQEIEALKSNGMSQMLADIQTKCQGLETEKQDLEMELMAEKAKVSSYRYSTVKAAEMLTSVMDMDRYNHLGEAGTG